MRGRANRRGIVALALLCGVLLGSGCYSYSSYQTARTLTPGETAVLPSANRFQPTDDELEFEAGDWSVELQVRAGVVKHFDLGVKASRIFLEDGYQFVAVDPKVALVPNRIAFSMPIGTFWGQDIPEELQLHPTLILSHPLQEGRIELAGAVKALVLFDDLSGDADDPSTKTIWGFNVGARFHSQSERWALHPEIGVLIDDQEDATSWVQAGLGVWVQTSRGKQP